MFLLSIKIANEQDAFFFLRIFKQIPEFVNGLVPLCVFLNLRREGGLVFYLFSFFFTIMMSHNVGIYMYWEGS